MVIWQTTTASLLSRLTVKLLLQRDVSVDRLRGQIGAIERLFPEHPFPAGHEDSVGAYRQLLDLGIAPTRIVLSGISAGGGMALGVLLALRDCGVPLPAGAILMSPLTDLTDPHDGSRVANAAQMSNPYVSPAFGDFTGLPPLFFQVGSTEILLDDSRRCAALARAAGVRAECEVWQEMPHRWQGLPVGPESRRAIEHCADFVRECCP